MEWFPILVEESIDETTARISHARCVTAEESINGQGKRERRAGL